MVVVVVVVVVVAIVVANYSFIMLRPNIGIIDSEDYEQIAGY